MVKFLLPVGLALLLHATPAVADPREAFQRAWTRLELSDASDSPGLRAYVLYPYLQAERLRRRLAAGERPDAAISALLAAHPPSELPPSRGLLRDWMRALAAAGEWARFEAAYAGVREPEPELRCLALQARAQRGERDLDAALALWLTGRSMPEACTAPFAWLQAEGRLTAERRLARARLAAAEGNADLIAYLIRGLAPAQVRTLQAQIELLREPSRALERLASDRRGVPPEDLTRAFEPLARREPPRAARLLERWQQAATLPAETLTHWRQLIGYGHALSRRAEALDWLDGATVDPRIHEWRVRAALWNGRWDLAGRWLAALPEALATQPRWRYWQARAQAQRGDAAARAGFESLQGANNVYALLASRALGQPHLPRPQAAAAADPALLRALERQLPAQRAREWLALERRLEAQLEWNRLLAELDPAQTLQAAHLAFDWGDARLAIATAARAQVFDDFSLLYPRPHAEAVQRAAAAAALDPALLFAVMRQESLYDPRAVSRAKAYGLVQLLLPTAQAVARRQGLPRPGTAGELFEPARNLRLGAHYLAEMAGRWDGQWLLALASYNAGPGAVARWLPAAPMEADIWMENVPYNETRDYLHKLLWHRTVFGWREQGRAQDLGAWLQPVRPVTPP